MTQHRLLLSIDKRRLARLPVADFLWRPLSEPSSFRTSISPGLEEFADTPRSNIEFMRLAVLAYLVDRTTPRPNRGWLRELELTIPVWNQGAWSAVAGELALVLGFLTSDHWTLSFARARTPRAAVSTPSPRGPAVALFSGGADSLVGAVVAHDELDSAPVLASHRDWSLVTGAQNRLLNALGDLWGGPPPTASATIGRERRQVGSGLPFGGEPTSRSRSLLFVAFGLAIASATGSPLLINENGFASLNPPMGGERRGALSTRTTHPWYLWKLRRILEQVGAHAQLETPFASKTKSDMFRRAVELVGSETASELLSASHSCGRGDLRFAAVQGAIHCGVCFGCLVRRAAFRAAGIADFTTYVIEDLTSPIGSHDGWYSEKRARDLQAVRYAARRGVDAAEVTRALPPDVDPTDAIDVVTRGLDELAALVL